MTDRPIIFSAPMVRALLAGRKTQTRRKLRVPTPFDPSDDIDAPICSGFIEPLYRRGDRLYVRETHALVGSVDPGWLLFRANGYESECRRHGFDIPYPPESKVRWRPSIHMPRWASRLTLIVTDVRVQRLQDITNADAIAEGIKRLHEPNGFRDYLSDDPDRRLAMQPSFISLWNSLHGPDAWDQNPWVVAVSFDVRRGNIDNLPAPQKERTPRERGIFTGGV